MSDSILRLVRPNEPPEEWQDVREALEPFRRDKQQIALKQVAESRKERHAEWDEPDADEEGA